MSLWRINYFLMPFYTMPPSHPDNACLVHMWVPVDDEHLVNWRPRWHPNRALTEEECCGFIFEHAPATPEAYGDIRLTATRANNYFMNWEIHRTRMFGVPTVHLEDVCITESQGPIADRTKENLTQSDCPTIAVRARLINAAKELVHPGTSPAGVRDPSFYRGIRGASIRLPKEASWVEAMNERSVIALENSEPYAE